MNRIIKFRAWDKKNKEMFKPYCIEDTLSFNLDELSTKYSLMQFTGLLDKNGKEIYEGDIVECIDASRHNIVWNEDYACFCLSNRAYIGVNKQDMENYEVTGNTYENPNLLTNERK